ncbi:MAG: tetratricopeptide repeat protein [Saprospiraceae bacterium]|nr:tetratricopeptide repeat protein [Saprospiraceae bacterium]
MSFQSKIEQSSLFRSFKAIDAGEFRQIVRYYERYEQEVLQLEFDEYFEILVAYTNALFEISEYKKHIKLADIVIETSIIENISEVNGQEIFQSTLFKKASSHYNLFEYKKAIHVLQELLKIDPTDTDSSHFLEHCLREDKPQIAHHSRAISVLFFLLAAFTVAIEMIVVRNFYPDLVSKIEFLRNAMFVLGLNILVLGVLWHRLKIYNEVQQFINCVKKTKKK